MRPPRFELDDDDEIFSQSAHLHLAPQWMPASKHAIPWGTWIFCSGSGVEWGVSLTFALNAFGFFSRVATDGLISLLA